MELKISSQKRLFLCAISKYGLCMHAPPLPILKYSSSMSNTGGNERAQL